MRTKLELPAAYKEELCRLLIVHVPHATVVAFGSRVHPIASSPRCHEGSDLDLVIRYEQTSNTQAPRIHALREALRESALPILVDVHDWNNLPATFHKEILACHYVLQKGDETTIAPASN